MDFHLTPSGMAVAGKPTYQPPIILLGRIEKSMNERTAVIVPQGIKCDGIGSTPLFHAPFLLIVRRARGSVMRHDRGFEVVSHGNYQVSIASRWTTPNPLPHIGRKPSHGARCFLAD